ncbi:MAG: hypothetical protein KF886_03480 [Candidatus Hydrogenedentes bacterium]|nr:hypothetical protein [Candidatus Hydrogenedentota bacterium]
MVEKHSRWGGPWLAAEIEQELELLKELRREIENGPDRVSMGPLRLDTVRERMRELREELAEAREREKKDTNG